MNKNQKGFTIIELVVVIAIIAILASIVMINVSSYINKAKDASAKEAMHTLQTDVISLANGGVYTAAVTADCSTSDSAYNALHGTGGFDTSMTCHGSSSTTPVDSSWCAVIKLPSTTTAAPTYYCVDSTGAAIVSAQTTYALTCPTTTGVCVP